MQGGARQDNRERPFVCVPAARGHVHGVSELETQDGLQTEEGLQTPQDGGIFRGGGTALHRHGGNVT